MEKEEKKQHKIAQTYAEDMAKVLEGEQGGLIKKIIHGEEEHEMEKRNLSSESIKNKFFMITGGVLLFSTLAVLFFFFFNKDISTVDIEKQFTPLIFIDQNKFLEVKGFDKKAVVQSILNELHNTEIKNGGIKGIYLTENRKIIGWNQFLLLTQSSFKSGIFVDDNFLFGMVNNIESSISQKGRDFFILLKVRSSVDVFDSLRAWEDKMFFDLYGFFGMDITSLTKYLLTADLEDGIVENKNARILYDQDRQIVLMYIFADDNSVIITNTTLAAREIMLRLASGQVKK
ncbi:hypothetical protein A2818_02080 [Candidatus Nomurabacteria bacterium RIFCSPHIGHO2_01_FULL_40_12]|uniref:Uncharacterized protein n=1 Tax=Candidatus Nomurabacteria bacterium RIFCSPHIGHO2_01_FULL_40_12 TaxID=1801737 RepID=A0A1F6UZR7_9BACT|nr:MAG: hypothetical protein A2818_02080 [Candidatus Nomurabacteria bacterium RIFCSPHIGHO2_01_FULL_40_12]